MCFKIIRIQKLSAEWLRMKQQPLSKHFCNTLSLKEKKDLP